MIKLTMLSSAEKVKGQGVASAYRELVNLLEERYKNEIDMKINSFEKSDITHYHTVDFRFSFDFLRRNEAFGSDMSIFTRNNGREPQITLDCSRSFL